MRVYPVIIAILCITGCKVGPNYTKPDVVVPEHYQEEQPEKMDVISDEELAQWWSTFQDPFLENLIETALSQNFDYKIALERIAQARAQYRIQFAQIFPELDASASGSRSRVSKSFKSSTPTPSTTTTTNTTTTVTPIATTTAATTSMTTTPVKTASTFNNIYQVGLDVIWEIDLWGQLRRSADASLDLWQASVEDMRGVKISMISEVANTYATICSYQKQKHIAEQLVIFDEELLLLSLERFEAGLANEQEVEGQIAALDTDAAQLTQIQAALKSSIYSMAILLGKLPEQLIADFEVERAIPRSVDKVPAGLPSELLRRRPDIRSAERQLAAATEQIGVAIAELFPTLSLTGSNATNATNPLGGANVGFTSDSTHRLFRRASNIWGIGGLMELPIFDFGKRQSNVAVQRALCNQAYLLYQKVVVAAFQETETVLTAYFNEEIREKCLDNQVQANMRTLTLTTDLFKAGLSDYTQVLAAREVWLNSLNILTASRQALATDLIAVYKALGGDWQ